MVISKSAVGHGVLMRPTPVGSGSGAAGGGDMAGPDIRSESYAQGLRDAAHTITVTYRTEQTLNDVSKVPADPEAARATLRFAECILKDLHHLSPDNLVGDPSPEAALYVEEVRRATIRLEGKG